MTGLHPPATAAASAERLSRDGYCIIPAALPASAIRTLEAALARDFQATPFCRGAFYGGRTKRFGRLLVRAPTCARLIEHRLVLAVVERVLGPWCDAVQLNLAQAIEIHPGERGQVPHRDQDMWHGDKGRIEYVVNVMWPLTPFRADNGATRIWPGSHGRAALDPEPRGDAIVAEATPGSAIVFLGSTLHAAGANVSDGVRRGIVVGYSLGWLKAYENPYLAYPPAVARAFPPGLAALVGYRQHRPNLGNYEGQCPSVLLGDHIPDHLAATDALLPEQAAMIEAYHAREAEAPA